MTCIFENRSSVPSCYFKILSSNGSLISVYCDMEGSNCDGKGGWMSVGYLNMSKPNATCFPLKYVTTHASDYGRHRSVYYFLSCSAFIGII